ncbi:hypothetical protein [Mesorhizobium sp. B1-1-5]|uniref:hypothetical protein n=1 Tax=Mesorhizobium sp. B1-1-5 TaxID=2589979 RepID=UPI0015E3637C|nr:hypothetical protein [Mesorhizobium sp. B1-1-5]
MHAKGQDLDHLPVAEQMLLQPIEGFGQLGKGLQGKALVKSMLTTSAPVGQHLFTSAAS